MVYFGNRKTPNPQHPATPHKCTVLYYLNLIEPTAPSWRGLQAKAGLDCPKCYCSCFSNPDQAIIMAEAHMV
jgi:hypothetical protein